MYLAASALTIAVAWFAITAERVRPLIADYDSANYEEPLMGSDVTTTDALNGSIVDAFEPVESPMIPAPAPAPSRPTIESFGAELNSYRAPARPSVDEGDVTAADAINSLEENVAEGVEQ